MTLNKYVCREVERQEWDFYWAKIVGSNLLQSWQYGEAKRSSQSWIPFRYAIESTDGEVVAITQILTKTVPILGGVARINRGPLLLSKAIDQSPGAYLDLLRSILELKKINRWWLFFMSPEINKGKLKNIDLIGLGLKLRKSAPWGSSSLNLSIDGDFLFKNLKGKWRNLLRKAQKSDIKVRKVCSKDPEFESLLSLYENMKNKKNFVGMPTDLLRNLSRCQGAEWNFNVYIGELAVDSEILGMLISVHHGNTATYLISYAGSSGRKVNVNYLLLFQAIIDAKAAGCRSFDLGGLNKNTPKGIAHFKRGVSGVEYELLGEYVSKIF
jgi:lipid II:glycine glycyltransferase (peptidoglycan interpeptide bridge formation enzyme)